MTILVSEGYFLKVMLHWQAKCGLHDDIIQKHLLSSAMCKFLCWMPILQIQVKYEFESNLKSSWPYLLGKYWIVIEVSI